MCCTSPHLHWPENLNPPYSPHPKIRWHSNLVQHCQNSPPPAPGPHLSSSSLSLGLATMVYNEQSLIICVCVVLSLEDHISKFRLCVFETVKLKNWTSFDDCRGQSYDNGDNMRGKNMWIQTRILEKNIRSLYVLCGAHTLNFALDDAAKSSTDATILPFYRSSSPCSWFLLTNGLFWKATSILF